MIKLPKTFMGKPIKGSIERVLAAAEEEQGQVHTDEGVSLSDSMNPSIQSLADIWLISGVQYRNSIYTVDLMKTLLDDGSTKTQDAWATHYESGRDQNEFHIPDYPLLYGILKTLYTVRDDATKATEVAEAQKFLKNTSRAKWLMTLTRIQYQPSGNDVIVHNFGTRDRYEEQVPLVGGNGKINPGDAVLPYKKLLGTNDNTPEILEVFKWLNDTDISIHRVKNRPSTVDERVARFGANSGVAGLDCNWDPSLSYSGLGARLSRVV